MFNPLQFWAVANISYCQFVAEQYAVCAAFFEAVNNEDRSASIRKQYEQDSESPNVLHVHF